MDFEQYMRLALELAAAALEAGEVPVGCVIADERGNIAGCGQNTRERSRSVLGHAELSAIDAACRARGDWRLDGCTLFVTLEPCPMCAGAILNARLSRVVYGAREARFGSCGSVVDLFSENYGFHPAVYRGVLEPECRALMERFFKNMRQ